MSSSQPLHIFSSKFLSMDLKGYSATIYNSQSIGGFHTYLSTVELLRYFMEIQHFHAHIYLRVGTILLFLAGIGSSNHSSAIFTEMGRCNSNIEKYITESYFEKHDSLFDSDFQDFLVNKLPLCSCELLQDILGFVPRPSVVHRHLIGEGSHRRLSSSIRLEISPPSKSEIPAHFCEAIIVERLPSGVFADPFELQHLLQRGVFTDAAAFGDTNLELPSLRSNRSVVEVHMDIGPNILSGNKNGLEINVELPLHARYPPLGEGGYSRVEFGPPDLFTRCCIEGKLDNHSCIFISDEGRAGSEASTVVWEVPCGIKEHAGVVTVITFVSAIVSAFLIVLASVYYSDITAYNDIKQA